jgi:hypothetical protein
LAVGCGKCSIFSPGDIVKKLKEAQTIPHGKQIGPYLFSCLITVWNSLTCGLTVYIN